MGLAQRFSALWSPVHEAPASNEVTLADVVSRYDLVEVAHSSTGAPYLVVSDREAEPGTIALREPPDMALLSELGSTSPSPFVSFARQEYNRELAGLNGLEKYERMRKSDGTVRGTLRAVKTPVLAGRWFVEPASDSTRDRNAAEFVWKCLTEYMSISFPQLLTEALLMADFGYYMFEKVWEFRTIEGKERLIWKKLAPRHPMDVKEWRFDAHGGPAGVIMWPPHALHTQTFGYRPGNGLENTHTVDNTGIGIPIDKMLVFTFDREAGNIQGTSVLRSAYKHWYYKEQLYKIDAIQKERHGIGIPVIKLPPGYSPDDKAAANQLGRNLRTNERAHVVLPPNWELFFAKLEGHVVNALESAEHHDARIRENILAPFLGEDATTKTEDVDMFMKSTRFIADIVCETFNTYAIPQLVDLNYDRVGMPRLRVRRIGEENDQRTLSFTVRNMIGAKAITPDEVLEEYLRRELDLPMMDKATQRVEQVAVAPKGAGPDAPGMPRQTPPSPQKQAPNAGVDQSGGK